RLTEGRDSASSIVPRQAPSSVGGPPPNLCPRWNLVSTIGRAERLLRRNRGEGSGLSCRVTISPRGPHAPTCPRSSGDRPPAPRPRPGETQGAHAALESLHDRGRGRLGVRLLPAPAA